MAQRCFVTGATGNVGFAIVRELLRRGHAVAALLRDPQRARLREGLAAVDAELAPHLERLQELQGDVTDPASLTAALAASGPVDWLFHAAGLPEQWLRDETLFERVNVEGTRNVLQAAAEAAPRPSRVVYISTMDVFAAPNGGTLSESTMDREPKPSAYERSKVRAQELATELAAERGLHLASICPSGVFGPCPALTGFNKWFADELNGRNPALPDSGCSLVYNEDVAAAAVAAAERAPAGALYLVSDRFYHFTEMASMAQEVAGMPQRRAWVAPLWLLGAVATLQVPFNSRIEPTITRGMVAFFRWQPRCDSSKAARELGYVPSDFKEAVTKTVRCLREARRLDADRPSRRCVK